MKKMTELERAQFIKALKEAKMAMDEVVRNSSPEVKDEAIKVRDAVYELVKKQAMENK